MTSEESMMCEVVEKAPEDKHNYHHFVLPNGLECIIVEAPSTNSSQVTPAGDGSSTEAKVNSEVAAAPSNPRMAGVALSVKAGYFADPDVMPGLAHFLEHMLFMGSTKYPGENEWEEYVSKAGGYSNACTDAEHTTYLFEIMPTHLLHALDMFAQFFVSPLFAKSALKREVKAVESEFVEVNTHDSTRLQDLMIHTAKTGHPASKFGWGNLNTLWTTPLSKGVDISSQIRNFHNTYYSSHGMRLAIVVDSGPSIPFPQDIEAAVRASFADVRTLLSSDLNESKHANTSSTSLVSPTTRAPLLNYAKHGDPFEGACQAQLFRYVPIRDDDTLCISWSLPPQTTPTHHACKPVDFVEHLLGHEGPGSLLSLLKLRGYATALVASSGPEEPVRNTAYTILSISITLTKKGLHEYEDVTSLVLQAVRLISNADDTTLKRLWDETAQMALVSFRFESPQDPVDMAESLAGAMQLHPAKHVLTGPALYTQFSAEMIRDVCRRLSHARMRIDLGSMEFSAGHTAAYKEAEDSKLQQELMSIKSAVSVGSSKSNAGGKKPVLGGKKASRGSGSASKGRRDLLSEAIAHGGRVEATPHFKVLYTREQISEKTLSEWADAPIDPLLAFPPPNPFIPEDLSLLPPLPLPSPSPSHPLVGAPWNVHIETPLLLRGLPTFSRLVNGKRVPHPIDIPSLNGTFSLTNDNQKSKDERSVCTMTDEPSSNESKVLEGSILDGPWPLCKHNWKACTQGELWCLGDRQFLQPRASFSFLYSSPVVFESPLSVFLGRLFLITLTDFLEEVTYAAQLAETSFDVDFLKMGYEFRFSGFRDKLPAAVTTYFTGIYKLIDTIAAEIESSTTNPSFEGVLLRRFPDMVHKTCTYIKHLFFEPSEQANNARLMLAQLQGFPIDDLTTIAQYALTVSGPPTSNSIATSSSGSSSSSSSPAAPTINGRTLQPSDFTPGALVTFAKSVFSKGYLYCLAHGNLTTSTIENVFDTVLTLLRNPQPLTDQERFTKHFVQIPKSAPVSLTVPSRNPHEQASSVIVHIQLGIFSRALGSISSLLSHILTEPFFDQLRTKEQLGYSVSIDEIGYDNVYAMSFEITSSSHPVSHIRERMEAFLIEYRSTTLANMTHKEFNRLKDSLFASLLAPDSTMASLTNRVWGEIKGDTRLFARWHRVVSGLRHLSLETFKAAYDAFLLGIRPMSRNESITSSSLPSPALSLSSTDTSPAPSPIPSSSTLDTASTTLPTTTNPAEQLLEFINPLNLIDPPTTSLQTDMSATTLPSPDNINWSRRQITVTVKGLRALTGRTGSDLDEGELKGDEEGHATDEENEDEDETGGLGEEDEDYGHENEDEDEGMVGEEEDGILDNGDDEVLETEAMEDNVDTAASPAPTPSPALSQGSTTKSNNRGKSKRITATALIATAQEELEKAKQRETSIDMNNGDWTDVLRWRTSKPLLD